MRALTRALLFLVALLGFGSPALAEERITAFASTITVHQDGSLDVVERILVNVENVAIRHGIYRDFPTRSWYCRTRLPDCWFSEFCTTEIARCNSWTER